MVRLFEGAHVGTVWPCNYAAISVFLQKTQSYLLGRRSIGVTNLLSLQRYIHQSNFGILLRIYMLKSAGQISTLEGVYSFKASLACRSTGTVGLWHTLICLSSIITIVL